MIKTNIAIRNPFAKDAPVKFDFWKALVITKNKSFEFQIWHGSMYCLFEFSLDLSWRGCDHAGPSLYISLFGWDVTFKLYDNRHWDYKNGTWQLHTQS
jgi:hypothetical protein